MTKKRLICHDHDAIQEDLEAILKLLEGKLTGIKIKKIKKLIKRIERVVSHARASGQLMEDRLQDYYNAIKKLGFKRNKK